MMGNEEMMICVRIDSDCRSMESYFHKLFALLQEGKAEDELAPVEVCDLDTNETHSSYHRFSHLVKPDMLMNVYSLVDFWLSEICEYHRRNLNLSLGSRDIKGENELHARHKYLTTYAVLNLSAVQDNYKKLEDLRNVRNRFVHGGGHIPNDQKKKFTAINGISLSGTLIVIDNSFVWCMLEHANKYLQAAALA